jgi:hypothetical protein
MKRILNYNNYLLKESFYTIDTPFQYEWVKTTTLWKYREFDRSEYNDKIEKYIDILSQEGFNQPLILHYSHKYKTVYLTEGNHRLLAALRAGIEYVPVRVTIDGVERKDAHEVIGFYSEEEKVDPPLPSQIGIPDCLDKNGNPVKSEDRSFEDAVVNYEEELSKFPDIDHFEKVEEGCYNIWVKMQWWEIYQFMKSEQSHNIESAINDDPKYFFDNNINDGDLTDFIKGNYFTPEMKNFLGLKEDMTFKEEHEYFWDEFTESPYYKKYLEEIKRIIWDKYKSENISDFKFGGFETPFDGTIEWWYTEKYRSDLHYVQGIIVKNELLECYDSFDGYKTFKEVLKDAYNREISNEWKVSNLFNKIPLESLVFKNIFN